MAKIPPGEPVRSVKDIDPIGLPDLKELKTTVLSKASTKPRTQTQLAHWWRGCVAVHRYKYDGMAYFPTHRQSGLLHTLYTNSTWRLDYYLKAIEATVKYWGDWKAHAHRPMPDSPDIVMLWSDSATWYEWIIKNVSRDRDGA